MKRLNKTILCPLYSGGDGRYVKSSAPVKQRIAVDYGDGTVRTESGDVWRVKETNHGLVGVA